MWRLLLFLLLCAIPAEAQMNMAGMENSVGYLSSGTSIEPKATSESGSMVHASLGSWTVMFHANAFLVSIQQTGPRGRDKVFSSNWMMPMLARTWGRQSITFRPMVSFEPATVTYRRYPALFLSGETAYGIPIVDAQHPHDFIMELAGRYDLRFGEKAGLFLYGGPVGDPALGPTAFPHRASASESVLAIGGHHQQDATHISNSVITVGVTGGPIQLEASTFHGRESNENRWNFDGGKPDSFATRLSASAGNNLSGQFSIGRINSREPLEPDVDTIRTTSSIQHFVTLGSGHIASSLIWGRNKDLTHHGPRIFNSYAFESTVKFKNRNWVWTRIENMDRDARILVGETRAALEVEEDPIGRVQAYTLGYERDLPVGISFLNVGLGAQVTTYGMPPAVKAVYGEHAKSFVVFLRLRPKGNMADHMKQMHHR
jgi:hypothetical protein